MANKQQKANYMKYINFEVIAHGRRDTKYIING